MSSPAERMSSRFAWSKASWASFFAAISRKKTVQHIKAELGARRSEAIEESLRR
jgi:hypothetical protein